MDSTEMNKLPPRSPDNLGEDSNLTEEDLCLPESQNFNRRSMEHINKNRENEDHNNMALDSEKNKLNDCRGKYKPTITSKKPSRFGKFKFNAPPSKFEKWCSEKTGLSRVGLIIQGVVLLLLFILIIVVIIMSCLWPTLPHSLTFPVCRTSACLLASSEVLTKMNQSIDPCEDIREYACGHWFNSHSIPHDKCEWGVKPHMKHKHRERIRDLITTMTHPEDSTERIQWKIKNFYDSCMAVGIVETEGFRPLRKIIKMLGGWRVLREFSLETWDMRRTLRVMHSKYNIQPFFQVDVVPDAKQPLQSIIQISPGNLGLPDKTYYYRRADDKVVLAYKRFLKDVTMTLGATSDDASTFSEDLFGFEKRLAERFPTRIPERHGQYRPTIAKLEEIAPSVPFFDILSALFPNVKLSKKTEVVVVASDHLVNVSRIISTTDTSVLNDYMMWRLAVGYLPYLSKKCRNTINEFHRHLYGYKEPTSRWEMCIETLQKFMGFGLEALIENNFPDTYPEKKCKVVNGVFEEIKTATRNAIETSNNLPPHVQEHFLDKINNIGVQIGLPVSMLHPSYYNDYYSSLTSIKDDFFQNVLNGVSFLLEEQQRRLREPSEEHRWMDIGTDGNLKVSYIPEVNKVIIPLALLAMPYFHLHYPQSVLYGGIGAEIGVAILSSVTGRGLFHSGDGTMLSSDHPVCNITHDCFLHHPLATPYLEAIKYTYKALENVLVGLPHAHQPAMEYLEDEAIFFVSYAQSLCTMKTPEKRNIDAALKSYLNDVTILQMLMSKSKQFSAAFSCKNPLQKDTCDSLI